MCRFVDRPPSSQSLAPPPAVVHLHRVSLSTCMTEFGYKHETENYSICAKCLYQKPSHERHVYKFAVRHYVQICRERIVPECHVCAENLGVPRSLSECEQCSTITFPAFLDYLTQQGASFDDLDDWTRVFTRQQSNIVISPRLAAFSASLLNLH